MKNWIPISAWVCSLMLWSCDEFRKTEISQEQATAMLGKEFLEDVDIIYSDSAKIEIRIKAPQMIRYTAAGMEKEEFPKGFQAVFYDDQSQVLNTLASKYAIRVRKEGKTYMRDSVVFTSINQEILKTSELIWDETFGKIVTDKFVRIIRKDEMIQGYGFETDQNFKTGTIKAIDAIIPSEKLYREDGKSGNSGQK
ncbi:MAG TPA: LPS export ABC transporter periplasmic protein LptC [Saprospiraceae bacterium]|nr:LPS export ABC transporter periplasmic protein LptC [Saprospiraceae bacterium]